MNTKNDTKHWYETLFRSKNLALTTHERWWFAKHDSIESAWELCEFSSTMLGYLIATIGDGTDTPEQRSLWHTRVDLLVVGRMGVRYPESIETMIQTLRDYANGLVGRDVAASNYEAVRAYLYSVHNPQKNHFVGALCADEIRKRFPRPPADREGLPCGA